MASVMGPVSAARLMLVDHGRAPAVMAHPRHQVAQPRAAGRRELVSGMAEIVKVQSLGADRLHRMRPGGHLVEVAPPQRVAHQSRECQCPRLGLDEDRQMLAQYRDDRLRDADNAPPRLPN